MAIADFKKRLLDILEQYRIDVSSIEAMDKAEYYRQQITKASDYLDINEFLKAAIELYKIEHANDNIAELIDSTNDDFKRLNGFWLDLILYYWSEDIFKETGMDKPYSKSEKF